LGRRISKASAHEQQLLQLQQLDITDDIVIPENGHSKHNGVNEKATNNVTVEVKSDETVKNGADNTNIYHDERSDKRWATSFCDQYTTLVMRAYKQTRGERITGLYLTQYLAMSFIVGILWFNLKKKEAEIQDKIGCVFNLILFFFLVFLFVFFFLFLFLVIL
jgi:hypothetical protein